MDRIPRQWNLSGDRQNHGATVNIYESNVVLAVSNAIYFAACFPCDALWFIKKTFCVSAWLGESYPHPQGTGCGHAGRAVALAVKTTPVANDRKSTGNAGVQLNRFGHFNSYVLCHRNSSIVMYYVTGIHVTGIQDILGHYPCLISYILTKVKKKPMRKWVLSKYVRTLSCIILYVV